MYKYIKNIAIIRNKYFTQKPKDIQHTLNNRRTGEIYYDLRRKIKNFSYEKKTYSNTGSKKT